MPRVCTVCAFNIQRRPVLFNSDIPVWVKEHAPPGEAVPPSPPSPKTDVNIQFSKP